MFIILYDHRLEETVKEGEVLLLAERQQKEEANAALAESHIRDQAFAIKIEDAEKQIALLQETVKRSVPKVHFSTDSIE
jgi:myosin-5